MSRETYQQAINLMKQKEDECDFVGKRPEKIIKIAENAIGFRFSKMYRDFVLNFGAGNFGSQEIYGVINDDFKNSSVPDAIWYTLTERKQYKLPNHFLVIYDTGMGVLYCLNFESVNEMGEPNVIEYIPGVKIDEQEFASIAKDFGDFLLDIIEEEI